MNEKEGAVLKLVDDNRDELISFLRKLISFRTITPQDKEKAVGDHYRALQDLIDKTLKELGFETERWEIDAAELDNYVGSGVKPDRDMSNMPVVVGRASGSGGGRSLILNGHYDVVPVGILENWSHDPFGGEIEDGRIFGRGTNDMKGGIAAIMTAIKCIRKTNIPLRGDLIVEVVPDEEETCMGTLSCCQKGYRADAAVIPEPTDMQILVAVRGGFYGKIVVLGRAGHAEMPQPDWTEGGAVNAISKSLPVLRALEELTEEWKGRPDKQHKYLEPDYIMPTVIHGGDWLVTYPEKVEIQFSSMFIPGTKDIAEQLEKKLSSLADEDPWFRENPPRVEVFNMHHGAEVDENEPIVKLAKEVLSDIGIEPKLRGYGTLTDSIHLINYAKIPTISIGPDIKTAHMADEFAEIGELLATAKALALLIMRWCG